MNRLKLLCCHNMLFESITILETLAHYLLAFPPKSCSRLHILALLCYLAFFTVHKIDARHLKEKSWLRWSSPTPSKDSSTAQKIEVWAPAWGLLRAGDRIAWVGKDTFNQGKSPAHFVTFSNILASSCSHRSGLPQLLTKIHFCDESTQSSQHLWWISRIKMPLLKNN